MSDALPIWKCDFNAADGGHPLNNLTVGSIFKLKCHGDIPVDWDKSAVSVVFPNKKEGEFTLVVLKADKLESTDAELTVTGYKAGQFKPEYIRLAQGKNASGVIEIAKPAWEIRTVLKQGEQPQPYPPFGPWGVGLPLWFMLVIGLLVGLITLFTVRFVRRRMQRQRMLTNLATHKTALSPVNQFYKDARQLRKRLNNAKTGEEIKDVAIQLDREFRLFVLRQFLVPALDWSDRAIVDDIRKRHRKIFETSGDSLRKALRELTRIKARAAVSVADAEQLHQICLDAVEKMGVKA